jgi:hypothetical protein
MKLLDIEQNSEVWKDWRRDKIGGSDDKNIKPLSRGAMKDLIEGSAGFWHFVANTYSIAKDGESEMERGHRTEAENLRLTNQKCGLSMEKTGVWLSDFSDYVHISPDGAEPGTEPKHAFEGKSFDTHKHLSIIYFDLQAQDAGDYNPLYSLPTDNQDQVVKYFNVSDSLEVLHWSLINEMVVYDELTHYVIDIKREDVAHLIPRQREIELKAIAKRDEVMKYLLEKVSQDA